MQPQSEAVRPAVADTRKPGVVFKGTNWTVMRSKDSMTDKVSCTAYYRQRADIQLSKGAFYISLRGRGGIEAYQFRFDEAPAIPLRLASRIEKDISSIILPDHEVRQLLAAKRLRVSGITVLRTPIEVDVDLSGITMAHGVLAGGDCS
jgi:hypothetical protein